MSVSGRLLFYCVSRETQVLFCGFIFARPFFLRVRAWMRARVLDQGELLGSRPGWSLPVLGQLELALFDQVIPDLVSLRSSDREARRAVNCSM